MADINQPNLPQPEHGETVRNETITDEMLARRRLLKLGVYVPPAVLGMMIVGGMPTPAQAALGSCCPNACNPCINLGNETNSKKCKHDWHRCRHAQHKLKKKGIHCPPLPNPCRRGGDEGGDEGGDRDGMGM